MAIAWLIEKISTGTPSTSDTDTEKRELMCSYPYLEAVGSARIMEISP